MSVPVDQFFATDGQGNQANGTWTDPTGWSEKFVPGPDDDAATSAAYNKTILYDTTDEVHTFGGLGGTLDIAGGSLTVDSAEDFNDGTVVYQGAIDVAAGASFILGTNAGVYQVYGFLNVGTVTIGSGATLDTGGTIDGTVTGGGTLELAASTLSTSTLTIAALDIGGGVTLGTNIDYGGTFVFSGNNAIVLAGFTLVLSGSSITLAAGISGGGGALDITGSAILNGFTTFGQGGAATIEDAGTISQTGSNSLAGELLIDADASYTITAASSLSDNGALTIVNNGAFTDDSSGGTSQVGGFGSTITNNGTLTIDSGDVLEIAGTDTLRGTITGAGTLEIDGSASISQNVMLGTLEFDGGTSTLGAAFTSFSGNFSFVGEAVVDLSGQALTLSGITNLTGSSSFVGGSTVKITGSAEIGNFEIEGTTLEDANSLTQTGNISIIDDQAGTTDTLGELLIDQGATYTLAAANSGINFGGNGGFLINDGNFIVDYSGQADSSAAQLTNNGTLTVEAGDNFTLYTFVINNGTLDAASGSLDIRGPLSATGQDAGVVEIGAGQSVEFASSVADQEVLFNGTSASALLDDPSEFSATLAGFAAGDTVDLTNIGYSSTYEAVYFVGPTGGTLEIIDTAHDNSVVATLKLSGDDADGLFTLASDGAYGTQIGFTPYQSFDFGSGDVVFSNISGQSYSAYVENFTEGTYTGTDLIFTSVPTGSQFSAYAYDYSAGNEFIGSQFYYTNVPSGANYSAYEYDVDGGDNVTRVTFSGVTGAGYSSYQYDYVGGIFAGSKFDVTAVPQGATYTSYELDYDTNSNFSGDKFFFTNLSSQTYTSEEADFNGSDQLVKLLLSGFSSEPYASLELDYSGGAPAGYKAIYDFSGQAFSAEEVDVNSDNQLTKVIYDGLNPSSVPYSSLEVDYSNGVVTGEVYDFTNVPSASYYSYQVEENTSGIAQQETLDNNDGSHTIIGLGAANQTFTSIGDDTFTGGGSNETFVFNPVYGHDTITDFASYLSGASHDTISVSTSEFDGMAALIAGTKNVGGNAVITAENGETITLDNLSVSALSANQGDFTFHS